MEVQSPCAALWRQFRPTSTSTTRPPTLNVAFRDMSDTKSEKEEEDEDEEEEEESS